MVLKSSPIGACNVELLLGSYGRPTGKQTNEPTKQPTDKRTEGVIG